MRLVLALGLIVVAALFAAQPATAKSLPPPAATYTPPQAELRLATQDGYLVVVRGRGSKVTLSVLSFRDLSEAIYATRGTVSRGRIKARFGHFGRVSVHFAPSGRIVRTAPPDGCRGKPMIERHGTFSGVIRFRGEEGYISLDAHRAAGSSNTPPRWGCRRQRAGGASASRKRSRLEAVELTASTPGKRVFFRAVGLRDSREKKTIPFALIVSTEERRGSVRIARSLLELPERDRAFAVSEDGRTATLRPPRPFHGMAAFDRDAPAPERWAGNLSVNMIGATVPLTGPGFRVSLVLDAGRKDRAQDQAAATLSRRLPPWLRAFTTW